MTKNTQTEKKRVVKLLKYIEENPNGIFPNGWIEQVKSEAMDLGIIEQSIIGQNCKPSFFEPLYSHDL